MTYSSEIGQCPKCGGQELGQGKHSGYAVMTPVDKVFTTGSEIVHTICTDCGYILESYVTKPDKFKGS